MPERSFGRTVRHRRTKLGLSQAQLGDLVGRSASSIRSWERDISTPSDASVLLALAAVLDLDERSLFEKAGVDVPPEETNPTVEEALASLAPVPVAEPDVMPEKLSGPEPEWAKTSDPQPYPVSLDEASQPPAEEIGEDLDIDSELEAEVQEHLEADPSDIGPVRDEDREPEPVFEPFSLLPEPIRETEMHNTPEPAFIAPPEPFIISAPTPPLTEASYIEDNEQRQLYRVRNLATVVLFVGLIIILLWSLTNALDAFGEWWDDFFGTLRL